uniref:Uncharacterized protein n=1 Tax=uncultured marine virus TaxID=186617 RepID=A0A0F7L4C8_9VIRU|nr:hypothetical protein [uncultured marine virus]
MLPCQHPSREANLGLGISCFSPAASIFSFHSRFILSQSERVVVQAFVIVAWARRFILTCSSVP